MSGKRTFELTHDQVDDIIVTTLKGTYEDFKKPCDPPCWSYDPCKEAKENKKMLKAFKRVLDWYGAKVD